MNYSDIIALAKAGFTAQQIAQLAQSNEQSAPAAPIVQDQPQAVPVVPEQSQASPDQLTAILAEMQTLKQTVQAQNRQNAELIPPKPQTAQDVLASIIAPPTKDGEK